MTLLYRFERIPYGKRQRTEARPDAALQIGELHVQIEVIVNDVPTAMDPESQDHPDHVQRLKPERGKATLLWKRLGRHLHVLSHGRLVFWVLAFYFQFKTMFLSSDGTLINNLSTTLLMYGVAMSFESLRDSGRVAKKRNANSPPTGQAFVGQYQRSLRAGCFLLQRAVTCSLLPISVNWDGLSRPSAWACCPLAGSSTIS